MFNSKIGKYYPIDSKIHSLNPVIKLLSFFMMLIMICFTNDFVVEGILFIFLLLVIVLSNVEIRLFFKPIWKMKFLFLGILILEIICHHSYEIIFIYFLRLINLILSSSILLYTTKNRDLIYGLEIIFKPLIMLGLPIRSMIMMISLALGFIPNLMLELEKILKSLICRGMDYRDSNTNEKWEIIKAVVNPMFIYTLKKADRISENMELQGYEIEKERTNYRKYEVAYFDYFYLGIHLLFFISILIKGVL